MTTKLVIENLKHRPMRSLLSILLIGVPVTLILTLVGMTHGMLDDAQQRTRGSGADVLVRGSTAGSLTSFSGAAIDERFVPRFAQLPHVEVATGVVAHNIDLPLAIFGIDLDSFSKLTGGFQYQSGGPFQKPDDMIVDVAYATQRHLKVGDTYNQIHHDWHICGIVEPGKLIRLAVQLKALQELDLVEGKVSVVYVKADVPTNAELVKQEIQKLQPSFNTTTMAEWLSQLTISNPQLGSLRIFTNVVVGIGVVIAFAVVCLAQYMAVLQRTREIGMLKSLGAGKTFILGIILLEALAIGFGGAVLGIVMSYGAQALIGHLVPASIQMAIVYDWWPRATAITLLAALLGAMYPGLNAAGHDPIEALAYE